MKSYIDTLQKEAADARRQQEEASAKQAGMDKRLLCDTPLTLQIQELMLSLPPASRDRPWSMEELVSRLRGRYRLKPHPMNIGAALRAIGWQRKRDWTNFGGGRRYWYPPSAN